MRYRPSGRAVVIALWRANIKPPLEVVVDNLGRKDFVDLLGDVGVEDRRYNESDDRSVAVPDRMESPPLGTVCTVADGDIRLASL